MEKIISMKELRTNFSEILKGLEKGNTYILIYRSKPIARLKPWEEDNKKPNKK